MDLKDSAAEAAWRAEVRDFLARELPSEIRVRRGGPFATTAGPQAEGEVAGGEIRPGGAGFKLAGGPWGVWRARLAERGWIAPAWPKEYGGAGLSVMQQFILNEEFAVAGAPALGGLAVTMTGPTLIVHGTEEQKAEHLPKILAGEAQWCQGLSEPGAGSDLASLQTRAVLDGDEFVINGSKIWTSGAQTANWMFLLARTDPDAPKHRGITCFLLDFSSPGISVRPLVNMAGGRGFSQVFFDDVRVPAKNVVGEVDRGWYIATTTLDFERSGIGTAVGISQTVDELIAWARTDADGGSTLKRNPALRYELADRYIEAQVGKMLSYRVVDMQNHGLIPNHQASMAKLYATELTQRIYRTAIKATGLHGLAWDPASAYAANGARYSRGYVQTVSSTIAGGTSEIQRNIIAQRGLGMPRD